MIKVSCFYSYCIANCSWKGQTTNRLHVFHFDFFPKFSFEKQCVFLSQCMNPLTQIHSKSYLPSGTFKAWFLRFWMQCFFSHKVIEITSNHLPFMYVTTFAKHQLKLFPVKSPLVWLQRQHLIVSHTSCNATKLFSKCSWWFEIFDFLTSGRWLTLVFCVCTLIYVAHKPCLMYRCMSFYRIFQVIFLLAAIITYIHCIWTDN